MQDINNTPNTEQNRSAVPSDEWKELLKTPEVMSSSGSQSSRSISAPADYPWDVESSSVPSSSSSSSSSSHSSHEVTAKYSNFIKGESVLAPLHFTAHIRPLVTAVRKELPVPFQISR